MSDPLCGAILFDGIGPHPRLVRMLALEQGRSLNARVLDIRSGENRREPFLTVNPMGSVPVLRLAGGETIADSLAICEFLEENAPAAAPRLLGKSALERAQVRTWVHRVQADLAAPLVLGARAGPFREMFEERVRLLPSECSPALLDLARHALDRLASRLSATYIVGETFSLADIYLFVWVEFADRVGVTIPSEYSGFRQWHKRVAERPSALGSVQPRDRTNQ